MITHHIMKKNVKNIYKVKKHLTKPIFIYIMLKAKGINVWEVLQ